MKEYILVVGGYGKVGSLISEFLVTQFDYKVIIAGRNQSRAKALADRLGSRATGIYFNPEDTSAITMDDALKDVLVVIQTFDLSDLTFPRFCLNNGIPYLDITPSIDLLRGLKDLDNIAKQNKTAALIGIGLSPGLTNLTIKKMLERNPKIKHIEIHSVLGSGETAGFQSYWWSFSNAIRSFSYYVDDQLVRSSSFSESKRYQFQENGEFRIVYRFNFPEQQTLPETLGLASCSYWLCYEKESDTKFIARLRWLFRSNVLRKQLARYFSKKSSGKDSFRARIEGKEIRESPRADQIIYIEGLDQGKLTAYITAACTDLFLEKMFDNPTSGVYYVEELLDFDQIVGIDNLLEINWS